MIGHIKLDRKILSWEWYSDANTFRVFVHLLLLASHKNTKWMGVDIHRGQLITGRLKLAATLHLSEQSIRTSLSRLKSTSEITIKTTTQYSIITICKYDTYQSFDNSINQQDNQQDNQQLTNEQPTSNQRVTTFNNVNNVNKNIYKEAQVKILYPTESDHNMILPDIYIKNAIEYLDRNKQIKKSEGQILVMWEMFKLENFTGKKFYQSNSDIYTHFLRSIKNEKNGQPNNTSSNQSNSKVNALKKW